MAGGSNGVTRLCEFSSAPVVFFKLIMSEKLNQFSRFEGQDCLKFIAGLKNKTQPIFFLFLPTEREPLTHF